ncbi:probable nitrilase, putitive [Rhynchosporium agropyri]|uniref:Probable nitrilase, putitive n=1 Tax=Rhynchosporium agropyri TaxID=914238 RepID=A0A1E1L346_9HELO|nr:probable nitrilase, putitive [Rhynchosporium agropyri]
MAIAAIGQLCSTASMSHNLALCQTLVKKAVDAGAKALFLPEASDYIASSSLESLSLAQPMSSSPFLLGLQASAKASSLAINVGVHVPAPSGKMFNRSCWINEKGEIESYYDKLHLFDYGKLRESDSVEAGKSIGRPVETAVGRIGLCICFDLRFPEISLSHARQNAQILTYPSAFTVPTGKAHWETLLRARAIETQAYVIAAAQIGAHNEKRTSYGHSMVVDPWGQVLLDMTGEGSKAEIGVVDLDLGYWERVREGMPLLRRTDAYPEFYILD